MKEFPPVNADPIRELKNIREVLFRVAVALEEEKRGNAAMVVALMANRVGDVAEHMQRSKDNATSPNLSN